MSETRTTQTSAPAGPAVVDGVWLLVVAVVAARVGLTLGMWPLALRPGGGIEQPNLTALLVHGIGALAALGFLLARSKAGTILALAYTGYSTVALGLGNPRPVLTAIIWVVGVLALAALGWALLRGYVGHRSAPSRSTVLTAVVALVVAAGAVTALVLGRL